MKPAVAQPIICDIPADLWNLDVPTLIGMLESQQSLLEFLLIPITEAQVAEMPERVAPPHQQIVNEVVELVYQLKLGVLFHMIVIDNRRIYVCLFSMHVLMGQISIM